MSITSTNLNLLSPIGRITVPEAVEAVNVRARGQDAIGRDLPERRRSQDFARPDSQDSRQALARLSPLRPQLSPAEEVELFGGPVVYGDGIPVEEVQITLGQAIAEDGSEVEVESIAPSFIGQQPEAANVVELSPTIKAQAQAAAASLYARNSDIVFSSQPLAALAA